MANNISHFDLILKIKQIFKENNIDCVISHRLLASKNVFTIQWNWGFSEAKALEILQTKINYTVKVNSNYFIFVRKYEYNKVTELFGTKWGAYDLDPTFFDNFFKNFSFNSDNIEILELDWSEKAITNFSQNCQIKYMDLLTNKNYKTKEDIIINSGSLVMPETFTKPKAETLEVKSNNISVITYSEKSVAVIGDTKDIKEKLKALGGKWNSNLTNKETNEKFGGWIFSINKLESIEKLIES